MHPGKSNQLLDLLKRTGGDDMRSSGEIQIFQFITGFIWIEEHLFGNLYLTQWSDIISMLFAVYVVYSTHDTFHRSSRDPARSPQRSG